MTLLELKSTGTSFPNDSVLQKSLNGSPLPDEGSPLAAQGDLDELGGEVLGARDDVQGLPVHGEGNLSGRRTAVSCG